jgi:predicted RNase H-like HicB family nuclease
MKTFTAYVEFDPATALYVGIVPGLRGAHTQAASLDELEVNLKEVVGECVKQLGPDFNEAAIPELVGLCRFEIDA